MGLYGATNVCDRRSQDTSITISNQHINDRGYALVVDSKNEYVSV
jgi:hypothetical protein